MFSAVTRRIVLGQTIDLPVGGLPSTVDLPDEFAEEARLLLALKLFEQGPISSVKTGTLWVLGRVGFPFAAGRASVPVVDLSDDALAEEFSR